MAYSNLGEYPQQPSKLVFARFYLHSAFSIMSHSLRQRREAFSCERHFQARLAVITYDCGKLSVILVYQINNNPHHYILLLRATFRYHQSESY